VEDHRCRIVAVVAEDCRCRNRFDGTTIEAEDPRYKSLTRRVDIEVEDSRCNNIAFEMEDPRCRGLTSKW
jgi:hypothetical protein